LTNPIRALTVCRAIRHNVETFYEAKSFLALTLAVLGLTASASAAGELGQVAAATEDF